jgi:hypothetical protein
LRKSSYWYLIFTGVLREGEKEFLYLYYLTRQEQILIYNDSLPRPNPNDAGPGWNRTWVCSDASSTDMQYLRPLCHCRAQY